MKCPVCSGTDLLLAERQGIEIDYCPSCRGVWLDRGELDKIIERAGAYMEPQVHRHQQVYQGEHDEIRHEHDGSTFRHGHGHEPYRKKKKSFLGEIFDF